MKKDTIQKIIQLLYTGRWNLSMQEMEQIINPILQELNEELEKKEKPEEKSPDKDSVK